MKETVYNLAKNQLLDDCSLAESFQILFKSDIHLKNCVFDRSVNKINLELVM